MYNFQTKESEPIDVAQILGTGEFSWDDFGKGRVETRTDNNNLQTFKIMMHSITTYSGNGSTKRKIIGLDVRAKTNSRQARTEIQPDGMFLCNHQGLQWYLVKCDYSTKDLNGNSYSSQYHRSPRTSGDAWDSNYSDRQDFKSGSRYYVVAIDPMRAYPSSVFSESTYQTWGIAADGARRKKTTDQHVMLVCDGADNLTVYVSKCNGLDFITANNIWSDKLGTLLVPSLKDKCIKWLDTMLSRDIEDYELGLTIKQETKELEFDPLKVKYAQQFKNAKDILRVGHLRFARVSDANPQKTGNSVIDLIEWYGIIPVLNVPKTVVFDCNDQYFVHHTNSVCGNCRNDNLELPSGRYVIDIDSHCFYYHSNYKYKYTKKAWILSSLANMSVTIDNDVIDRIIPIGGDGIKVQGIAVEDDDFLNRF